MTIDEAIKTLHAIPEALGNRQTLQRAYALKLGIEALKREREYREGEPKTASQLLPGETEE